MRIDTSDTAPVKRISTDETEDFSIRRDDGVRQVQGTVLGTSASSVNNACKLDRPRVPYDEIGRKAGCLNRAGPV
jgi:hypothetical protein